MGAPTKSGWENQPKVDGAPTKSGWEPPIEYQMGASVGRRMGAAIGGRILIGGGTYECGTKGFGTTLPWSFHLHRLTLWQREFGVNGATLKKVRIEAEP